MSENQTLRMGNFNFGNKSEPEELKSRLQGARDAERMSTEEILAP